MWILECDGDLLRHRRIWLRPGRTFLFGRTTVGSPNERNFHITAKSVSRKHLLVSVEPVTPGDGLLVHKKSQLTIKDESRVGTSIDNGPRIIGETKFLSGNSHTIKLGSFDQLLRISWHPVVLSISIKNKEPKRRSDALLNYQQRLEDLDVKTILPYIIDSTTHAVDKRNTSRGLQALINAKYVVTEQYVDAIAQAASSPGFAEDGETPLPSSLEEDFDANWPDAMKYLPAPGVKEKDPKAPQFFAPDHERISLFEGFTFIFGDGKQFEALQAPITNGGAKCLLYEIETGVTRAADFAERVREAAGLKGLAGEGDPDKGIVVVRLQAGSEAAEWSKNFVQEVDLDLGQRSVEQNEFLDAVLTKDTSKLRQPLREASTQWTRVSSTAVPQTPAQMQQSLASSQSQRQPQTGSPVREPESSAPPDESEAHDRPRKRFRRAAPTSRFKGFDDFDEDAIPRNRKPSPIPEASEENQAAQAQTTQTGRTGIESQSLFINDSQPAASPERSVSPQKSNTKKSQSKRHASTPLANDDDILDDMLPAARAMKRRRLQQDEDDDFAFGSSELPMPTENKKKSPKKQFDIRTEARSHAETIDKKRPDSFNVPRSITNGAYVRTDNTDLEDEDITTLRDLAIIEEMELKPRTDRPARNAPSRTRNPRKPDSTPPSAQNSNHTRWDPTWNGRKNFKRFRRAGQPAPNRGHRVIVGVEEAKQKDYGIGESYWLESPRQRRGHGQERGKDVASNRARRELVDDSDSQRDFMAIDDEDAAAIEELIPDAPAEESPTRPSRRGKTTSKSNVAVASSPKPSTRTNSKAAPSTTTSKKRPTSSRSTASQAPAPKKQRQTRLQARRAENDQDDEESSDEDELRFRFRKKGKT